MKEFVLLHTHSINNIASVTGDCDCLTLKIFRLLRRRSGVRGYCSRTCLVCS